MGIGYRLGEWTVRPHRNRIERGNESAHLEPKAMAVLDCLARASNSVVTRQQIFDSVWPSASVSDEVLTQRIAEIRKAFGDSAKQPKIVETIPKIGFRLIPRVVPLSEDLESGSKTHRPFAAGHGLKWFAILVLGLVVVASYFWVTRPTDQQLLNGPAVPSIAVLPFLNRSDDPGDEHLSDGISDELINLLVQVPGLEVRSRSSSFSFKGENWKMEDIARELNASLIVDGQVRKVDKRVRITTQLIDPATDQYLWSEAYDRELSDIFVLQAEIAQSIVTALQDEIGPYTVVVERPTENLEAWQLFLQGRSYFYRRGPALDKAITLLQMAVDDDPEFAEAWTFLAAAAAVAWLHPTSISNEEAFQVAQRASSEALALNPKSGLTLATQAMLAWHYQGDLNRAFPLLDGALTQGPLDTTIRLWSGMFYSAWGYREEGFSHYEFALRNDPRVGILNSVFAVALLINGREHLAALHFDKATALGSPLHIFTQASHSMIRGETDTAFGLLKSYYAGHGADPEIRAWLHELEAVGRAYFADLVSTEAVISVIEMAPRGVTDKANLFMFFDLKDQFFQYFSLSVKESHFWPALIFPPLWLPEHKAYIEDPRFFEIMRWDGAVELWEQRGYPDGCIRVNNPAGDHLDCSKRYQ